MSSSRAKGLIKGTVSKKKKFFWIQNFVLISSTNLVCNILILHLIQRDTITNVHTSACEVPASPETFKINLELSRNYSEKSSKTLFHKNLFCGRPAVPREQAGNQADWQTRRSYNSRFSQFCEHAKKKKANEISRREYQGHCCIYRHQRWAERSNTR